MYIKIAVWFSFLLRKRLFCVLVTFWTFCFLSLFSKVLFGGESWTQERTVACWILSLALCNLLMTITYSILVRMKIVFLILQKWGQNSWLFLHLLSSLFLVSGHSSRHPQYSGAGDFLLDLSLWSGSWANLLVHCRRAFWPVSPSHCYGLH